MYNRYYETGRNCPEGRGKQGEGRERKNGKEKNEKDKMKTELCEWRREGN